jgi:hypothetical protein
MAQFVQGQGAPGGQDNPNALVEQNLNQVAAKLKEVAQVLSTAKPALMPVLQRALQALSMVMSEVQSGKKEQGQPGVERGQPGPPGPEGANGASPAPPMG